MDEETKDNEIESDKDSILPGHDEDEVIDTEDSLLSKIKTLREKLKECEKERIEFLSGWQRTKADFINARKENEARRKGDIIFANERLILSLIPTLDSFDHAFNNRESWEKVDKNWRVGVEFIHSQLSTALKDNGLSTFGDIGDTFDPAKHTAVETVFSYDKEKGGLVERVLQKGYELNGKVVRSAKVNVYEYKPTTNSDHPVEGPRQSQDDEQP